jgi:hypothetical protein
MKRRASGALAAAILVLGLAPGLAQAVAIPGTLDQSVGPSATYYLRDSNMTQTFTAGLSGALTHIALYCASDGSGTANISVSVGTSSGLAQCEDTPGWADVILIGSQTVTAGQQYTITIPSSVPMKLYAAASNYSGGEAAENGGPITNVSDIAFRTYVWNPSTTTYAWSKSNVAPGATTAVTLTATTQFDALDVSVDVSGSVWPAEPLITYSVKLGALPSWFTPTSIVCSAQIVPADCTVANFGTGLAAAGDPTTAMTVTVVVTGTADPASSADGTTGTASGQGCITGPGLDGPVSLCSAGSANLLVARTTPPPTSTAGGSGSSDAQLPMGLPFALAGFAGLLLVLRIRTQRRYSARP